MLLRMIHVYSSMKNAPYWSVPMLQDPSWINDPKIGATMGAHRSKDASTTKEMSKISR